MSSNKKRFLKVLVIVLVSLMVIMVGDVQSVLAQYASTQVRISLPGCEASFFRFICPSVPKFLFSADDFLNNERIRAIYYILEGDIYFCEGSLCLMPVITEGYLETEITFWAVTSYGDESEHFTARIRVEELEQGGWQVTVISSQLEGVHIPACLLTWGVFPPLEDDMPLWLRSSSPMESLASDKSYAYLAGQLIKHGFVDADDCSSGGVLPSGYANSCGIRRAHSEVVRWQNQFDEHIFRVSTQTGVPAQLLKNIIAQESQFWPGLLSMDGEFGLAHLTEMGADMLLLWNSSFFQSFCRRVLSRQVCQAGYVNMTEMDKAMLRGALVQEVDTWCPQCQYGFNIKRAYYSIDVLAQSLIASCKQVNQILSNTVLYYGQDLGAVSSYEDLWRFTLANYHAGAGCLSDAVRYAWVPGQRLSWQKVADSFTVGCHTAVDYVDKITNEW